MLPEEPGSETSCIASGRNESFDSRPVNNSGSKFTAWYASRFVAVVVDMDEACRRAGEVPLSTEAASDNAHVANSAVSSRTH